MKEMRKLILLYSLVIMGYSQVDAQPDTIKAEMSVTGYIDIFYAYDFNKPNQGYRQPFLFHHNRHNEFNLNHGFARLMVIHPRYHANIALHAGTYVEDNYAQEPNMLAHVFQANIGFALNKLNTLWIDAGIFPSHIGFETALSIENLTLTRSLLAENSPYYLAGAKLSYQLSDSWTLTGLICNGWQRIQRLKENTLPSFGTQVVFSPSKEMILNWSTFVGTDSPDSARRMRYFNNLYAQRSITDVTTVVAGFDIGVEQQSKGSRDYHLWYTYSLIIRQQVFDKWSLAGRVEYYNDKHNVIIPADTGEKFSTHGLSLNLDYKPIDNVMWRIEGRWLKSRGTTFQRDNRSVDDNFLLISSLAVKF